MTSAVKNSDPQNFQFTQATNCNVRAKNKEKSKSQHFFETIIKKITKKNKGSIKTKNKGKLYITINNIEWIKYNEKQNKKKTDKNKFVHHFLSTDAAVFFSLNQTTHGWHIKTAKPQSNTIKQKQNATMLCLKLMWHCATLKKEIPPKTLKKKTKGKKNPQNIEYLHTRIYNKNLSQKKTKSALKQKRNPI